MPWYACLLATMIVAGAMPVDGAIKPYDTIDQVQAYGPACQRAADQQGMGGSHASCPYSCGAYAALVIGVKASDPQGFSYGNTECADASAACAESAPVCVGASYSLTSFAQEKATCHGSSDEMWDSPVFVACMATTAAEPKEEVCDYANICPTDASSASAPTAPTFALATPTLLEQILEACPGAASAVATVFGEFLAAFPNGRIQSLVLVRFAGDLQLEVSIEDGQCRIFDGLVGAATV